MSDPTPKAVPADTPTPMTDTLWGNSCCTEYKMYDHAKKLERKLAAANAELEVRQAKIMRYKNELAAEQTAHISTGHTLGAKCQSLFDELAAANAELAQWPKWGTIEVMIRNPAVAESIAHWEGRAIKAEGELAEAKVDAERRLRYVYDTTMAQLVKPYMTYENWIAQIDIVTARKEGEKK